MSMLISLGTHNAARRLLDGVTTLSGTLSELSSAPSKNVSQWLADRVAPSYWRPNSEITNCHLCDKRLDIVSQKIHHCRACGEGFCNDCSDYKRPVPERGWDPDEYVRVCRDCFGPLGLKTKAVRSHDAVAATAVSAEGKSTDPRESLHARRYLLYSG